MTPRSLLRPFRRGVVGLLTACLALLVVNGPIPSEAAPAAPAGAPAGALPAVFATGGEGSLKESIQWLQWADYSQFAGKAKPNVPVLDYGQSRSFTNYRDMGDAGSLVTTCTLSGLTFISHDGDVIPEWMAKGPLVATIPGTWAGDVLDNLYNVGGPGSWSGGSAVWQPGMVYPQDYTNNNQMVIGLANGYAYNGNKTWNGKHHWEHGADPTPTGGYSQVSFDVSCSAELQGRDGSTASVPLTGLVFADAEASSAAATNGEHRQAEWVQASVPPGTPVTWRLLDRLRSEGCQTTSSAHLWNNHLIRLNPSGDECVYQNGGDYLSPNGVGGPAAVMFMEGATSANITMQGGGYSAVALGLVIATDFGDGPASYGTASSLFQPSWDGGEVIDNSPSGVDLFGNLAPSTMAGGGTFLGETIDSESTLRHSDSADGDDTTGADDEDGVTLPEGGIQTAPGERFTQDVICRGPGMVAGWIDWNHNGTFDAGEKSGESACPEDSLPVELAWTVPADVVRSVDNETGSRPETYMRVRVSADDGELRPTGNTATGEVEDYRVAVRVPTLELVKKVSDTHSGDLPVAEANIWTVSAQGANGTAAPNRVQGAGRSDVTVVSRGTYALSESSEDAEAQGYEKDSWSCEETEGTVRAPRQARPGSNNGDSLRITGADRITCTLTNVTKPAVLRWEKVAEDGVTRLGGSSWLLRGPGYPDGVEITDCTHADECMPGEAPVFPMDMDPDPGVFRIEGRPWGIYTMTESRAPEGYTATTNSLCFAIAAPSLRGIDFEDASFPAECNRPPEGYEPTVEVTVQDSEDSTEGRVINRRGNGSVSWRKTDTAGTPLAGSQWRLTGPQGSDVDAEITDCVADSADACPTGQSYRDTDPVAGSFTVHGLPRQQGDYQLVESKAPAGYRLDTTARTFAINDGVPDYTFAQPITNEKTRTPLIPLTGGRGAHVFLISGAVLAGLALAAATVRRNRTRRSQH